MCKFWNGLILEMVLTGLSILVEVVLTMEVIRLVSSLLVFGDILDSYSIIKMEVVKKF